MRAAPPIQAPSESSIAGLCKVIEEKGLISGPVLCFDHERQLFVVAVVESGVIVHWQIESCHDLAEAEVLVQKYKGCAAEAVAQVPQQLRDDLTARLSVAIKRPFLQ